VRYTSALLFHGPRARQEGGQQLPRIGRCVGGPFGEEGLKIDDARSIIALMQSATVGDEPGAFIVGPLDLAQQNATDVLLKVIEEFDPEVVRPVLWANDLGAISSTIRSRCIHRWCPGLEEHDEEMLAFALDLLKAAVDKDRARAIELLRETKASPGDIIDACVRAMSLDPDQMSGKRYMFWERLRRLGGYRYVGKNEILAVFAGG